jgi:hypothetical protein
LPVHTTVASLRGPGAPEVDVGLQVSVIGSYRPPVRSEVPPHTTISRPVHTATWNARVEGAPRDAISVQVSVAGSYRLPSEYTVPTLFMPPNTIISLPVHTAVWKYRGSSSWAVGFQLSSRHTPSDAMAASSNRPDVPPISVGNSCFLLFHHESNGVFGHSTDANRTRPGLRARIATA